MAKPQKLQQRFSSMAKRAEIRVDVGPVREVEEQAVGGAFEPVEIGAHALDLFDAGGDLLAAGGAGDGGGGVVDGDQVHGCSLVRVVVMDGGCVR